jgi:ribokinase
LERLSEGVTRFATAAGFSTLRFPDETSTQTCTERQALKMDSPSRICVVGSANMDLMFRTARLPRAGETVASQSFQSGMGGKGANQAVAAARLGAQVSLVARVGNDAFGADAIRHYQADGIDTTFVTQDAVLATGVAAIAIDDDAENFIVVHPGANAGLNLEHIRAAAAVIQPANAVLCQLETPLDATVEAFRMARGAGALTMLTPAPATGLPDELLRLTDVLVPNRTEIEQLTQHQARNPGDVGDAAKSLCARGVKTVAVTMGPEGVIIVDEGNVIHIPATNVQAVDSTGAGDAFAAAFAVFLADGVALNEAARQATVVAALSVTRAGAYAAFPTRRELLDWRAS